MLDYHEFIAHMGEGSAHPGGFAETVQLLEKFAIEPGKRVLEVGCGTGRTACHLARRGYNVTALDLRPAMLDKAKNRAFMEGVNVRFVQGDASALPFSPSEFDIVFVESVTVFTDAMRTAREYYRVLRPGGRLLDREVVSIKKSKNESMNKEMSRFYGIKRMLTRHQWLQLLRTNRFKDVRTVRFKKNIPNFDMQYPDPYRQIEHPNLLDPNVLKMMLKNQQMLQFYKKYWGYAVFTGIK